MQPPHERRRPWTRRDCAERNRGCQQNRAELSLKIIELQEALLQPNKEKSEPERLSQNKI